MAKIQRNTQKIFGGNAPSDDIAALGSFKIGTPVYTDNIQALQNQAFEQGYGASLVANEAPFLEEQNSVPYVLSKQLAYNFQEGIPEYDVNTTYYIGSIVKTLNEENKPVLYYSIIDDNVGNEVTNAEAWEELTFTQDIPTVNLFDLIYSDHILEGDEAVGKALLGTYVYKTAVSGTREGYPDFYNKCVEEKNAGEETQVTLGSTTITMYVNANGHQFYNIADKDAVDTWYNTYGIAWYYGVDEENERIFLPRKDLVSITPKDTLKIYGDGKGLLLTGVAPNGSIVGTNVAGNLYTTNSYNNSKPMYLGNGGQGNLGTTTTSTPATAIVGTGIRYGVPTETQLKNAGWSSGLKTGAFSTDTNTFIYMVVGNTTQQSAITDVVDVTTSENDTIPLGFSTYQANAQPSVSWLASNGQWNSGNVYTTFYNYYVNKIGEAFANGFVKEHTDTYDDYDLVINEDDMTFRLPLLNGSESIIDYSSSKAIVSGIVSGFVAPSNGYIIVWSAAVSGSTKVILKVNGKRVGMAMGGSQIQDPVTFYALVKRGDIVTFSNTHISYTPSFFPMKGNGTLYFKVANAVQNLELMNAGAITEALANKIDNDAFKSYQNGTSGYVIFPNNYCIQWGQTTGSGIIEVPLLKNLGVINVILAMSITNRYIVGSTTHTTSSITFTTGSGSSTAATNTFNWCVMGYVA